jgi:hypothetical protein
MLAGAAFNNLSCAGFPTWGHTDGCFFLGCVADKWTLSACICCILLACCLGTFLFLSLEPTRLQELEVRILVWQMLSRTICRIYALHTYNK